MSTCSEFKLTKYHDEGAMFEWKNINFSSAKKLKSSNFYINTTDQCFLEIIISNVPGISYGNSVKTVLNFLGTNSLGQDVKFIVSLKSLPFNTGYTFTLTKTDDNVFTSRELPMKIYVCNTECKQFNFLVKVSYEKTNQNFLNNTILKDLENLMLSEEHTDFKIKVGLKTFNVHKCIVSSRCSVLKKIIESDMLEKKNGELELEKWDPIVVQEALTYIYIGQCTISKIPHDLFKLAHFLELTELQNECKKHLLQNINLKNIISTLELAWQDQYELNELSKVAMTFVSVHEKTLIQDIEFEAYLMNNMKISNIQFILRISYIYNLKEMMQYAMEFTKQNYKEILKNTECANYLQSNGDLLLKIFQYSSDSYTSELEKVNMVKNNESV